VKSPLLLVIGALCGALLTVAVQYRLGDVGPVGEVPPEQILAVVDGRPITVADFVAEMERRGGAANFAAADSRRGLLDDMVQLEVLAANARARGSLEEYDVRRDIEHILAGRYREEVIEPQLALLDVSDDEVAAYYAEHQARFTIPAAARAALIHFAIRRNAPEAVVAQIRERAARVHAEAAAQEGATLFGALAVANSDDQASRYQGGDTGWIAAGQADSRWEPAVLTAIFALEDPGQLAPLVETWDGLYVIRLVDKKAPSLRPLEEVAPAIHQLLLAEKRRRRSDALYAAAADNVDVEIHEDRLPAGAPGESPGERRPGPPPVPEL
jgi:parvulin-like peptidyl-prolyl isomerase